MTRTAGGCEGTEGLEETYEWSKEGGKGERNGVKGYMI